MKDFEELEAAVQREYFDVEEELVAIHERRKSEQAETPTRAVPRHGISLYTRKGKKR